jgi:hypothetical protein
MLGAAVPVAGVVPDSNGEPNGLGGVLGVPASKGDAGAVEPLLAGGAPKDELAPASVGAEDEEVPEEDVPDDDDEDPPELLPKLSCATDTAPPASPPASSRAIQGRMGDI